MTFYKHPLFKQIAGAVAGMLVMTGVYFAIQSATPQMTALLIGADSRVSNTAARVAVNDKTADPELIARLASKAREVASQLAPDSSADTTTQMEQNTMERLARRKQLAQYAAIAQPTVTTSSAASQTYISANEQARIARRRQELGLAAQELATKQVASGPGLHAGADLSRPHDLSQTGIPLPLLAVLALIGTSGISLWLRRGRLFAMEKAKN